MKLSINTILENPELLNHDRCWGFYDWFCKDNSLKKRALKFISKLKFLKEIGIIDGDRMYVWFKNNCPCNGSLYDDMRISLIEEGTFCGGLCPKTGHYNQTMKAELWFFDNSGEVQYIEALNWSELKKQLKSDKKLVEMIKHNWINNAI